MKKFFNLIFVTTIIALVFSGCMDKTDLTAPSASNPVNGNADLTRFVTIGNSLTAGWQNGALYASSQNYSFGNQIAKQVGTTFEQPLVSDPGTGGRMEIKTLDIAKGEIDIYYNPNKGNAENLKYQYPYNNLGIPGALLYDVLYATSSTTCASALFSSSHTPNPMFDLILRSHGSQFAQAKALHPTFITLWIGNNDVLGFATSGGFSPSEPTPVSGGLYNFQSAFTQLADSIASLGAKVVVANIPDVDAIPYFSTVGPVVAMETPWGALKLLGAPGIIYQKHGEIVASGVADSLSLLTGQLLMTLPAINYATLIGQPTGQYYRDNNYPALPPGIDTTKPFGLHPQNPWPDALILDASEIATTENTVASYNSIISSLANAKGFGLVDINSFFNSIRQKDFTGGVYFNGVNFSTTYITGGIFGLDGILPTNQGQAIVANEFIKVINSKFGANIPLINVATIPGSLILTKKALLKEKLIPHFEPGTFNHLLY